MARTPQPRYGIAEWFGRDIATLESSRRALNATEPQSKADFTRELKAVINDGNRTNKVFRASEAEAPE